MKYLSNYFIILFLFKYSIIGIACLDSRGPHNNPVTISINGEPGCSLHCSELFTIKYVCVYVCVFFLKLWASPAKSKMS